MSYPVVRLYASEAKAREAANKLIAEEFSEDAICIVTPAKAAAAAEGEEAAPAAGPVDIEAAMKAGELLGEDASVFAARVKAGRSLVIVDAPFGKGSVVAEILNSVGPVDTDVRRQAEQVSKSSGTLFSEFIGAPALTKKPGILLDFDEDLINTKDFTFSSFFGLGLLSRNPTPLSSLINFKPLSRRKENWTASFGIPLLSKPKGEWKSSLGMPLLIDQSKERKSSFGFPLLSGNPTPLSSMFGLRVLTTRR